MLGVLFGLLSAATFGFNNAAARRGVLTGTALQAVTISMPLGALVFLGGATLLNEWAELETLSPTSIGLFSAAGFVHFAWGRYFNIQSLKVVGSNLATPVQQLQLLIALVLAIIFLGETLTPLNILGILLIVSAPMYILRQRAKEAAAEKASPAPEEGFTPQLTKGYTYAFLAAVGFGSSTVLIKAGLDESDLTFLAGAIAYGATFIVVALVLLLPGKLAEVRSVDKISLRWFVFSGIGVSLSHMFRFLALSIAPVTIVQPLNSLSVIFRMIFGYILNREHEKFDRYVIIGIVLSFLGALSLALSSDVVASFLELPEWAVEFLQWTWP